jgi:hypothetical protein
VICPDPVICPEPVVCPECPDPVVYPELPYNCWCWSDPDSSAAPSMLYPAQ